MHTKRLLLIIICFILFTQIGFSQFNLADTIPSDPGLIIGHLSNGLTYYIRPNQKSFTNIQMRLVVNAGSILEDEDQLGLAHFMEHMNFNGSRHFPKNDLISYLESNGLKLGADLNAYTSYDETVYTLSIPAEDNKKTDKAFMILEDWARNALLDTNEINKERGIVLEESRLHKNANDRMQKIFMPKLYNGSVYAQKSPMGKDSIIANFKPDVLRRFYDSWYRPDLMAVIVVGSIDAAFAEKEIKKHFGDYGNPDNERPRPSIIPIPERKNNEGIVVTDKEFQGTILEVYNYLERSPAMHTWFDYRQSITEGLFNIMINERLSELTQQANPPFLAGNASFKEMNRGYRTFAYRAFIGDKPLQPAASALINTLESIKKFGFVQAELDRAKNILQNNAEKSYADIDKTESRKFVQEYINNYLEGAPVISISDRHEFIKLELPTINVAEVNALAKKMESGQGTFALLLAPEKNKNILPSSDELPTLIANAQKMPVAAYEEKSVASSLIDHQPVAGNIVGEKSNSLLGTVDLVLSNGVSITLKPTTFKNDDIQMDAWRWGGSHGYTLADKQNAMNAARMVQAMGVSNFSKSDLDKFLSGKTVDVHPYINSYEEGIEGKCNAGDFETFLQLIYLYFTKPRKDETLFASFVGRQKALTQNLRANPFNYFADTLIKIQYQNNPWAANLPVATDFDHINLDRAFAIYKEIFDNAYGQHFTFVGNFDIERIKPLLELYLGSLPSSQKENKYTDEGLRPAKGIVESTIAKGEARQSQVNIIFTGEAPYSRDENLKLMVLSEVISLKMFEQLRENMSGMYNGSMTESFSKRPYEHYTVNIRFPCGPENVEKLTKAMFDIIRNTQENGIDKKDLNKIKEILMKHHSGETHVNDYWLHALSQSWIDQDDPKWIYTFNNDVDAITTGELKKMAVKYLTLDNYIKVVLNPE